MRNRAPLFILIIAIIALLGLFWLKKIYPILVNYQEQGHNLEANISDSLSNDQTVPPQVKAEFNYLKTEASQP